MGLSALLCIADDYCTQFNESLSQFRKIETWSRWECPTTLLRKMIFVKIDKSID